MVTDTNKCACGDIATALVEYEDGEVEPVCEACYQAKKEYAGIMNYINKS